MDEALNLRFDPATAAAATVYAAKAVADHWLASDPAAAAHLHSGWNVAVEVVVTSDPVRLCISFVDPGTGERFVQRSVELPAAALLIAST